MGILVLLFTIIPAFATVKTDSVPLAPKGMKESSLIRLPVRVESSSAFITRSSQILVTVNVPCDEEWRNQSDWQTLAFNAIETADNMLYTSFSIDLSVTSNSYKNWDSNDSNVDNILLDEAKNEWGKGIYDMMIAFTAQSGNSAGGWET